VSLLSVYLPSRFLRGSGARLVLTVTAVACGVALVCAIDLVNRAVFRAFVEIVDTMAGRAALHVTAGPGGSFPEDVAVSVGNIPGVELAVPVVSAATFTTDGSGEALAVHGVDLTNDAAVRVYEPADAKGPEIEDLLAFLNQADSVILTREFADRRGLEVGDRIELETPTGRKWFTIRGLLAPEGVARVQGGNLIVMDIAAAQRGFLSSGLANRVDVVVRPDASVADVADAINAVLPAGLRVETPTQRKVDLHRVMQSIQTLLRAVGLFGLVAAFLIVFSRLTTVFEGRVWELAILRAVGVRVRRVWWELTKESLLVGVLGVGFGVPLGVALGRLLLPIIATTTSISSKLIFAPVQVAVSGASLATAVVLGLASVLLAAMLPAWRAALATVAEALRHRGVEQPDGVGPIRRAARPCLAAASGLAVVAHVLTGSVLSGLLASGLVVAALATSARPLVNALARPLEWAGSRWLGPAGHFAVATLLRNPRRTALAISTLAVGFGSVLWLWTLARSFEQSVVEVMPGVLRGDLAVSSTNVGAGYVEAPLDEAVVAELLQVEGVAAVVAEQAVDWRYAGGPIALNAFDPAYFTDRAFGSWPLVGRRLPDAGEAVARGDAVIVSENFVRNLRLDVGDVLTLETPSGPLRVRIAGVTRDFLSPRGTVEMSRSLYRRWWRDGQLMRALVRTSTGTDPEQVRLAIADRLGERYSIKVQPLGAVIAWFREQVRRAFGGLHVLAGLVLVVVLVGVGDSLAAGMLERTRELGVVRAIGLRRRHLGRAVLAEAMILALLGVALAWTLGLTLGAMWVQWTFPALLGWSLDLHVPWKLFLVVTLSAVVACLLASYLPARRAARLDPIAALRVE